MTCLHCDISYAKQVYSTKSEIIMLFPYYRHAAGAPMYLLVNKALLLSVICFVGQRDTARHLMSKLVASMTGINILQRMVNTVA